MKSIFAVAALSAGLLGCLSAYAQAPAGATALCKDGSYTNVSKKGACSRHGGVKDWYGDNASTTAPSATSPADKNTAVLVPNKSAASATGAMPAASGGPGQV